MCTFNFVTYCCIVRADIIKSSSLLIYNKLNTIELFEHVLYIDMYHNT